VAPNQAVLSERGLVGRVVEAGKSSAKVLLLNDINSRIPVMNERTREKMILVGKGTSLPTLSYVATDTSTKKGDRIITSGDGGVFPKNIAVGQIRDADKARMQVDLFVNMADVEYVSVVQYDR
jgi:rod shape-determining protein MreC